MSQSLCKIEVQADYQQEAADCESRGHVTDDIMDPKNVNIFPQWDRYLDPRNTFLVVCNIVQVRSQRRCRVSEMADIVQHLLPMTEHTHMHTLNTEHMLFTMHNACCQSSAMHSIGQNIKLPSFCVCPCVDKSVSTVLNYFYSSLATFLT